MGDSERGRAERKISDLARLFLSSIQILLRSVFLGLTCDRVADKAGKYPRHKLLGSRVLDCVHADFCWRNVLDIQEVHWLNDHVILDQVFFPAAGYIAMACESIRQLSESHLESHIIRDFSISSALFLKPGDKIGLRTQLHAAEMVEEAGEWYEIWIEYFDESDWIELCVGKVSPCHTPISKDSDLPMPNDSLRKQVSQTYWYDMLESNGLRYGPAFQRLGELSTSPAGYKAFGTLCSPGDTIKHIFHPVQVDQCLQIILLAGCRGQGRLLPGLPILTAIERIVVCVAEQTRLKVGATAVNNGSDRVKGTVSVVSCDGHPVLSAKGCEISFLHNDRMKRENKLFSFFKWDTDATYCNLNRDVRLCDSSLYSSIMIRALKLLAHKNPRLKILELGSGNDEITREVLKVLAGNFGERLYLTYTYAATSLDAAFKVKAAFKGNRSINVTFFVPEQLQSFEAGAFDVLITTDVSPIDAG